MLGNVRSTGARRAFARCSKLAVAVRAPLATLVVMSAAACSGDSMTGPSDAGAADSGGVSIDGAIPFREVGAAASQRIGPAGGTMTSTDGRLTIVFPPGALAAETAITIQQVEWSTGYAWLLSPDGLELASPATATITLPDDGASSSEEGGVRTTHLPVADVVHAPGQPDDGPVEIEWRETDGEIDYTLELRHFSLLVVQLRVGGADELLTSEVTTDGAFSVEVTRPVEEFADTTRPVACFLERGVDEHERPFELTLRSRTVVALAAYGVGGRVRFAGETREVSRGSRQGFAQDFRCDEAGEGSVSISATIEVELENPDDLIPFCRVVLPRVRLEARVIVHCTNAGAENGTACEASVECASGHCVDGMCCNEACDDVCVTCDLPESPGTCNTVHAGNADPDTCASPRVCDGVGVCVLANGAACETGVECLSGICADHRCCESECTDTCSTCALSASTAGRCVFVPADDIDMDTCPLPNRCDGMGGCNAPPGENGAPCATGDECRSGFCPPEDHVCCNEVCDRVCQSCVARTSRSADGTCDAIREDEDPDDECPGTQTCQAVELVPPATAYCKAHLGDPCVDDTFCSGGAGVCRNGVCCLNAGCGMGRSCTACAMRLTGMPDGTCASCTSCDPMTGICS